MDPRNFLARVAVGTIPLLAGCTDGGGGGGESPTPTGTPAATPTPTPTPIESDYGDGGY